MKIVKNLTPLLLIVALALFTVIPLYKASPGDYYYIYIKVKSNIDLKAGYPVVIKVGDLKKSLTQSFNWENVYVLYGDKAIPAR